MQQGALPVRPLGRLRGRRDQGGQQAGAGAGPGTQRRECPWPVPEEALTGGLAPASASGS
eukprot:4059474-Alexandrium_andersonii.AAC.1